MLKSKKAIVLLKTALSLWILYHLFVVLLMSNPGSWVGHHFQKFITPYANVTGFNTSWNFFAPNPTQTAYIRYLVHYENQEGEIVKEPQEGFFPQNKNQAIFDVRRRRELYFMHYILGRPFLLEKHFAPYICKTHPDASSVRLEGVVETVPPLDEALTFRQETLADLSKQVELIKQEYPCHAE